MEVELHDDSVDCTNGDYFCELCSLNFSTQNELEEHTWSMLHNTNLNRKKGRNCVHSCSLCKQEFVGLLEFTGHLHSEGHQEKLHKWRKDQHQEWSPDKQQQNSPKPDSPDQEKQNKPPSDWSADDFTGFVDYFSDHTGEAPMGDTWQGRGPPRDPRDLPSLLDCPPQFGYRYQEQFDSRRDRRDQFQGRRYPPWNEENRDWPREFRDSPPLNPEYPDMNYASQENDRYHWMRNSDEWQHERYYENRDEDLYSSRMYPGDGQRPSYDGNEEYRSRRGNQTYLHGNRNMRRRSNSPHRHRKQIKSVAGSVVPSRRQKDRRPSSRSSRAEGCSDSKQKEVHKQAEGKERPSETKRKEDRAAPKSSPSLGSPRKEDKTPSKSSPSSGSPGAKSTRKGNPRKLLRPAEEKKDEVASTGSGNSSVKGATQDKESERLMKKKHNKLEITITGKNDKGESSSVSQPVIEDKKSKSPTKSSSTTAVIAGTSLTKMPNFLGDSSATATKDSSTTTKEDSSTTVKKDSSIAVTKDSTSILKEEPKGDSSSSVKGNLLPTLDTSKGSLTAVQGKEHPLKVLNEQKASLLSLKGKENSGSQSKGNKETIISFPDKENPTKKESSLAFLQEKNDPSRNSTMDTLPVFEKDKDQQSFKLGGVSLLSTGEKRLAADAKDQAESSVTTDKLLMPSVTRDNIHVARNSSSLPPVDEKEKMFGLGVSNGGQKNIHPTVSSATISTISSLPWKEQEEKLRSLLGIKKEPKDSESPQDSTPCAVSKSNEVTTESEAHHPVVSSSTSVTALSSSSIKSASSRYVPGFSQLSLSRPQCSFVHIDGVQCGAVTWNKYCSYHQRVFGSEENNSQDQSLASKSSHLTRDETREIESSRRPLFSRTGGGQIFRPTTPSHKPPERPDTHAGLDMKTGLGDSEDIEKEQKQLSGSSKGAVRSSEEIDLDSTSPYKPLGSTVNATRGNIDLSTTFKGASRNLVFRGSSVAFNSDHSIGAETGSIIGANVITSTSSSNGAKIGASTGANIDLSDTVRRLGGTLAQQGTNLDSDNSPGIDLSGTVPNLEGLLALHGSSAIDRKTGPKIDLSKTVLKHGPSWGHQGSSGDSTSNIDLAATVSNRGSSVSTESGPSIDLNETIPQPRRSRTPQDSISRKESQASNLNQHAAADSVTSHLKGDALYPQMHLVKTEPGQEEAFSVQHTEMIDLNFSTKLLGVPHSVVAPFNASMHSSQKSPREMTKSPSEFSTQSSARSSPRSYAPSSPQSPLVSRRVSTTSPAPVDQRPGSTISLPNLSLDLSRFNLPPAVRKALAERYSGKKVTAATGSHPADSSEGRRSQPPFSEHKPEVPFDLGKKASPLPARLRGRGQRSVSLDSPIAQRGNIFETQQFFNRQVVKDGHHHSGLHVSSANTATVTRSSYDPSFGVHVPSTKVPPFSVPLRNVPHHPGVPSQENSTELQSRGLIDLSSTSYLERMSAPSVNEGRPADASRFSIDNLRSPPKPSALQSRGLIDLNTTTEYGVRDTVLESPEGLSAIKRKRLDSSEGTESVSSLVADKVVKRPKQGETLSREDKEVTYRPGINVQELLTIEREEQNQLQNLHAVQSRLKSVRAQIQKLCTELDSLSSEEQRITLRMGELRNMRLSILENACYERQGLPLPARSDTASTQETSKLTTLDNRDDSMTSTVLSESSTSVDKGDPFESVHTKTDGHLVCSSQDKTPRTNVKDPWSNNREDSKETEQIATEAKIDGDSTVCSSAESSLSTSSSSDVPQTGTQVSPVGTATKFVLREETLPTKDPRDKVEESINVASKRATKRSQSYNGAEINRGAKAPVQTYATRIGETVKTRDRTVDIPRTQQGGVPSSLDASSEQTAGSSPGNLDDQIRKYLVKKTKHSHRSEKALFRKKSFSDVNVSKTIEASRKKIQSVKENMKRWKQQEQRFDVRGSHEEQTEKNSSNCASSSSMDGAETSAENPGKEKSVSSPKIALQDKPSPRKTTKELKKSSLFHSGKKRSRESRRNKPEKSQARDKECKERAVVTSKRRKIDDTSPSTQRSAPTKEKTSSKGKGQVVSAAAHTTTAELGGSATEERSSTEDEIPTRDVDSQSYEARSGSSRSSHLQIPSSTSQNSKGNKKHRGPPACKFVGHTGAVCGLKVHDGHLFTCSADKTTRAFDIQSGECVKIYRGHTQAVNCVEVSEDRVRLFTGSNDQTVRSYNIKSGVCTHKFTFDGRVMCLHAAFDLLFVGLNTGIVASIDLVKNKCIERLHCHEPRGVSCLTTATEGQRKLLCCGSFDSTVTIRDYKTGLLIRTFSDHNMTVLCLQVVDNILYSGSADMKVQAHNLNTGELVRSFDGHTRSVSGLQVVGRVLVTSCLDKLIRCYDLMTGELLQVYGGQMDMIFSVLVSNGKIYSGGRDGSVVASKLDLRVYHPCKWENCNLNFGIVSHLKNHIQEYHVMEQGTVEACHWTQCGHQFSTDDDIAAVLKHVLGHVVKRTARKSSS